MFGRTFSFWRRWVGHSGDSASGPTGATLEAPIAQDDRRVWTRHPAELQARLQLADGQHHDKAPALVRDISRGGAMVYMGQEIQPGQLVNLDLPRADHAHPMTVLACVVRTHRTGDQWAMGCVFSRELTDDDLAGFGAQRVRHEPDDQRLWKRFDCQLRAKAQRIGAVASLPLDAEVLNLSASGIGLLTAESMEAGALLNIDLVGKDGRTARTILACVVHVSQRGDGPWGLGCNFIRELSEEDFQALV